MSKKPETRAERQKRLASKALAEQESRDWDQAPAGASAAADREAYDKRREWSELVARLNSAKANVQSERESLDWAKEGGAGEEVLHQSRLRIEEAQAQVAKLEAEVEKLRKKRKAEG